jgi:hypothetical protein
MYTTRPGILQVPRQDILMKIDLCTTTIIIYSLRAEENDKNQRET